MYTAFLPRTESNAKYAAVQAKCLATGTFPPSQAFGVAPVAKEGAGADRRTGGASRPHPTARVPGWDAAALAELPDDVRGLLLLPCESMNAAVALR